MLARLAGEVDLSNVDELATQLYGEVSNQPLAVIVDLTDVDYLDSAGVQLLFELKRRLKNRQQGMRVVVPQGSPLRRLVELVELDRVVGTDASVESARVALEAAGD